MKYNIILLLVSTFSSLIGLDLFIYNVYNKIIPASTDIFQNDPEIGYSFKPDSTSLINTKVGFIDPQINSDGYRGKKYYDRNIGKNIMFVGDSFTFGIPLKNEQTFTYKIGQELKGINTFNFGVPGYGPVHINTVLKRNCSKINPIHIFYMYYINDTSTSNLDPKQKIVRKGYLINTKDSNGNLYTEKQISERVEKYINKTSNWRISHALKFLNLRQFLAERNIHPTQIFISNSHSYKRMTISDFNKPEYSIKNVIQAKDYILKMNRESKSCGASFTMVILPSHNESYFGVLEPSTEYLTTLLDKRIDILDLRRHTKLGLNLIHWADGHYSEKGNIFVTNKVVDYINNRYKFTRKD